MMHQAAALSLSSAASVGGLFRSRVVVRKSSPAMRSPVALFGFGKKKNAESAATGDEYLVTYCQNW